MIFSIQNGRHFQNGCRFQNGRHLQNGQQRLENTWTHLKQDVLKMLFNIQNGRYFQNVRHFQNGRLFEYLITFVTSTIHMMSC